MNKLLKVCDFILSQHFIIIIVSKQTVYFATHKQKQLFIFDLDCAFTIDI